MKTEVNDLKIIKDEYGFLHIIFSCYNENTNDTEKVFTSIRDQASLNTDPLKWYEVSPELAMTYNKNSNTIEFIAKSLQEEALLNLPRRLSGDWQVIDSDEANRLMKYMRMHPLMEPLMDELENRGPK